MIDLQVIRSDIPPLPHCPQSQGPSTACLIGPPASSQGAETGYPPLQEIAVSPSSKEVGMRVHTGSLAHWPCNQRQIPIPVWDFCEGRVCRDEEDKTCRTLNRTPSIQRGLHHRYSLSPSLILLVLAITIITDNTGHCSAGS